MMEGIELELVEAPSLYNHQINDNDSWQQQHSSTAYDHHINDINDDHTPLSSSLSTPTTATASRVSPHNKKKLLFGLGALASILIIGVGVMSLTSSSKSETNISSANVDIGGGSPTTTMNTIGGNAVYTKGSGSIIAEPDEPPEEDEEEDEEECENQDHCDASFPVPPPKTRVKYVCTTAEGCTQVKIGKYGDDRWSGDGWNGKAGKGSTGSKGSKSSSLLDSWSGDGWITEGSPAHWGKLPSTSSGWSKSSKSWSGDGWITSWCGSKSGKGSKSKSGKSCHEKYTNTTTWMAPEVEEGPVWGSPAHWGKPSDKGDYQERDIGGGKCIHASEHPGYTVDGWDEVQQYSDDLSNLREFIVQLIVDSNRELIPKLLRLGFHDCVGGCDGCVDLNNMDNNGLLEAMDGLLPAVKKFWGKFSRADIWAMGTLVAAEQAAVANERKPDDLEFPMKFIGRCDCEDSELNGNGGPDVPMPSSDLTNHELFKFFRDDFDMNEEEGVLLMGAHAVAVAHRANIGFGNVNREDGWVEDANEYILDNRYYSSVQEPMWHQEFLNNEQFYDGMYKGIPDRYQWYIDPQGVGPIMLNVDIGLVRNLDGFIIEDQNGVEGLTLCRFTEEAEFDITPEISGVIIDHVPVCPHDVSSKELVERYANEPDQFLYDFSDALDKMVRNGYRHL